MEDYINDSYSLKKAIQISVYFRNPKHNHWFSINEKEKYTPASAMKLITLMAYLKKAELDPEILNQQLTFNKTANSTGYNFPPPKDLELGKTYTIDELINFMMVYSSNDAKDLLSENIDPAYVNRILKDLQLQVLDYQETENFMDIYTYSSFLRTLYNSSYLSDPMSEKALELLSRSTFNQGITSGLPGDLVVAHKFGERNNLDTGIKQLHDCGIIYYPNNHYLLCLMTKGQSFEDLEKIIQTISNITYRAVSS